MLCSVVFLILGCKIVTHKAGGMENSIMNISINENAPVIAKNEILINAPLEKVFSTLTDINNWVNWRHSISKCILIDPVAENAKFTWSSGGLNYKSVIHTIKEDAFGWTGTTIGAYAIHNWFFKEIDGKTLVKVEESLEGFFISSMKKSMKEKLEKFMITDLTELKKECEK
jgi:uncharacterized membrane protein